MNSHCKYVILTTDPSQKYEIKPSFTFTFIPQSKCNQNITNYTINNFGTLNFNTVVDNIEQIISPLSADNQKLIRKLIKEIIEKENISKSHLNKFKKMLIENTDVLGLFAQVLLAILLH